MSKLPQQFKAGGGGAFIAGSGGGPLKAFPANTLWPSYTDVLGNHGRRFVITENDDEFLAIIKNWRWWLEFEKEILQWLDDNEIYYELQGMVLTIYNKDDFAMFILRWA
jgi:hypothetical protein